jgi:hypothetical protein
MAVGVGVGAGMGVGVAVVIAIPPTMMAEGAEVALLMQIRIKFPTLFIRKESVRGTGRLPSVIFLPVPLSIGPDRLYPVFRARDRC